MSPFAYSEEPSRLRSFESEAISFEEKVHHEVTTDVETQNLTIKINEKTSIEIPAPSSYEVLQNYATLTENEKTIFQQRRISYLSRLTRILYALRLSYGSASLVKAHLKGMIYKYKSFRNQKTPLGELLESELIAKAQKEFLKIHPATAVDSSEFDSYYRSKFQKQIYEIDQIKEGIYPKDEFLKSRTHRILTDIIISADSVMWTQPKLIAQKNEAGWIASTGPLALAGWQEKGQGGFLEFGISFGYNKSEEAFIVEIFRGIEKFKDTKLSMIPVGLIGLQVKTGFYLANTNHSEAPMKKSGTTLYTPISPSYAQESSNFYNIGFSTSFGLPPGSDIMSYSTYSTKTNLIKLRFSKLLPGFVRVSLDPVVQTSWNWTLFKVKDFIEHLNQQYNPFASRLCKAILLQ